MLQWSRVALVDRDVQLGSLRFKLEDLLESETRNSSNPTTAPYSLPTLISSEEDFRENFNCTIYSTYSRFSSFLPIEEHFNCTEYFRPRAPHGIVAPTCHSRLYCDRAVNRQPGFPSKNSYNWSLQLHSLLIISIQTF